ncbi:calcium-binding protein [Arthrobacter sp. StoSoilA2]|uniref:SMP-30/gluconolactonase/LRE family protein n=1 Tax=Arthrobacter sp. StoSoilA2 TaxID=2830990 RepID=UPI001CC584BD|nr:SMP-30/gluconolactonase/LRE family protein [Arthrobacter sp. StoSoilA2]BCW35935.1 calcium-binding protein [Arthrobacter sp. StoSoilA2]
MKIQRVGDVKTALGEGPYWDPTAGVLYFVDILGNAIWRYNPDGDFFTSWPTPVQPSAISRTTDQRLITALADGFYDFDPDRGVFRLIAKVEFDNDEEQINDAKIDRQGRFVAGASNKSRRPGAGLYSFDGENVTKLDDGFTISNGPCWSPDGRTFYIADTIPKIIYAYDYDTATGALSNKRVFADTSDISGLPDGATVDADGRVWWTFVGSDGGLICYNPDGTIHQRLATGVKSMTSIQFGGEKFDTMYLTSLDPEKLGRPTSDPHSGALYKIEQTGVVGLPEPLATTMVHPPSTTTR